MKEGALPFYAIGAAGLLGLAHFFIAFEYYRFQEDDLKQYCRPAVTKGRARVGRDASCMRAEDLVVGRIVRVKAGRMAYESTSRIVATAGQRVAINGGALWIDGKVADDPWGKFKKPADFFPEMLVPTGCVFLLNDSRPADRYDSRSFGPVPLGALMFVFDIPAGAPQ